MNRLQRIEVERSQVVIHTQSVDCETTQDLVGSAALAEIIRLYAQHLARHDSVLLDRLPLDLRTKDGLTQFLGLLHLLAGKSLEELVQAGACPAEWLDCRGALLELVDDVYNFWRGHSRYMVLHSEPGPDGYDRRPYRAFNRHVEHLTHLVRGLYRDIAENVSGDHPRVYRQVAAGCNAAMIAVPRPCALPEPYRLLLGQIPFIRQVWIDPPLLLDPPMNKRTGEFVRVPQNPLQGALLEPSKYVCYPAQVGPLVIFIYFHQQFMGLGVALANLFELATDQQLAAGPDAVYVFGAPSQPLARFGDLPTVFFDDQPNGLLVGAVPLEDRFGYFGYLKKMVLTLHNIVMMKRGRMPFHGAMMRIVLTGGASANMLLIGDTATGKSETLEALRILGKDRVRELRIVADDMGSLEVRPDGQVVGFGTEIGAFIRLDDLQQGYAFGQIDRAIIMSPQKVNARVVLPVTTLDEVLHGWPVDFLLYANNYEEVDQEHPVLEPLPDAETAIEVFRAGAAMAKGTTTATGLVHSYFANIFGAPQYRELHDELAARTFDAIFATGAFVAQMRTRLGIPGYEARGPEEAAQALFALIEARHQEQLASASSR